LPQSIDLQQPDERAGILIPWTQPEDRPDTARFDETAGLVEALGCQLIFMRADQVRRPTPGYLLSGGLLDRLTEDVARESLSIVIMDAALTPVQQRNLERRLGAKVIDRTGLILEIFGLRARTREGRLQVELARLMYERSRLVRTWTHLERQRGGRGFLGGPGETQLEADKRMIDRAMQRLRADLEDVRRTRKVQRSGRQRRDVAMLALVGYTNAGKSSLFNMLTGSDVVAQNMPFATLDTTIRKMNLSDQTEVTLVDTVGFISDLPTHLIQSFQATLEETLHADLLIHVRDRASLSDQHQKQDVLQVLHQLAEFNQVVLPPMIEVWNKTDLLTPAQYEGLQAEAIHSEAQAGPVMVSAMTGQGMEALKACISDFLRTRRIQLRAHLEPEEGALRAWLHAHAEIKEEIHMETGGSILSVSIDERFWGQLVRQFPDQAETRFAIISGPDTN